MNIFVLDTDPKLAAEAHCDKHVVKMCLETAQLLCSAFEPGQVPYRRTHYNHPCAVWTRSSIDNFAWLTRLGWALCDEYAFRYGRTHASRSVIDDCWSKRETLGLPDVGLMPFALALPEKYREDDAVKAYRAYYLGEKRDIARWTRGRMQPMWWK